MMRISIAALFLIWLTSIATPAQGQEAPESRVRIFPSQLPASIDEWKLGSAPAEKNKTSYQLVIDERYGSVIKASAEGSIAGLYRKLAVDPYRYPIFTWSWKISNIIEPASLGDKESDDAAARIMISFGKDLLRGGRPKRSLCYVWAAHEQEGAFISSPYDDDIVIIVVQSTSALVGSWQHYRRNILSDYYRAFGEYPERIRAVSIISDGDNTGSTVNAWYGAISLTEDTDE